MHIFIDSFSLSFKNIFCVRFICETRFELNVVNTFVFRLTIKNRLHVHKYDCDLYNLQSYLYKEEQSIKQANRILRSIYVRF